MNFVHAQTILSRRHSCKRKFSQNKGFPTAKGFTIFQFILALVQCVTSRYTITVAKLYFYFVCDILLRHTVVCDKKITNQAETLAIILLKIETVQFNTLLPRDPLIELKVVLYNIDVTAMCSVAKCKQSCLIDH